MQFDGCANTNPGKRLQQNHSGMCIERHTDSFFILFSKKQQTKKHGVKMCRTGSGRVTFQKDLSHGARAAKTVTVQECAAIQKKLFCEH